ncbi:hypothetical protein [Streptomyces sp. NBC_01092]|uniref:hypothetical protein n=1 Tax=Streptomyces sp. NBC_01092 TaxID=2903748 RepID=UPI003866F58D|nr:hypothetical protein OG254_06920 [Streptomyces sp. NBC_01092]
MSPTAVAEAAELAATAWADPAAYEGTTEFGPGEMPAAFAATIILEELALRGWDLARATGQTFPVSEETAEVALGVLEQIADQAPANGSFGSPAPVAPTRPPPAARSRPSLSLQVRGLRLARANRTSWSQMVCAKVSGVKTADQPRPSGKSAR